MAAYLWTVAIGLAALLIGYWAGRRHEAAVREEAAQRAEAQAAAEVQRDPRAPANLNEEPSVIRRTRFTR